MHFPSKILLFGEYGLLKGSKGLIIPNEDMLGTLQFFMMGKSTGFQSESNRIINKLTEYIAKIGSCHFNFEQISYDLSEGLYFESNIPKNGGLGSSAALCAAIYDRYCLDKKEDLLELKADLAKMESFFHKKSSGVDPLASYLNKSLLISPSNIETLHKFKIKHSNLNLFLVKSNEECKTDVLVSLFEEKMKDSNYAIEIKQNYTSLINKSIKHFLGRNTILFRRYLKKLISFQHEYFDFSYNEEFLNISKEGIENKLFQLKILGSGGGYYLGFTENIAETRKYFQAKSHSIIVLDI